MDCMTGVQTARILARHDIPVIGMAKNPDHPCCSTRVLERIIACDIAGPELIETLRNLGPGLGQKAVLYPCTDLSVLLISRHREELQDWFHVVLPEPEVVELLIDKVQFLTWAQAQNLPIPPTFFLRSRQDAEKAARELNFPCVLKPAVKAPNWQSLAGVKVFKLSSASELLACYDRCAGWSDLFMVQEWIPGSDSSLYSCNCYFNADAQPLVTFVARKLRQWPPQTGTSCLGEEVRNDTVLEQTIELFRRANFRGLGYLEFKRDERSGKHFIIEPNIGRPTGRSAIAEAGGVELLYAMYCDTLGRPLPHNLTQKYRGTKWIYVRRDLQSAFHYWRRGELSFSQWLRSVRGPKEYALFAWNDPAPFWLDWKHAFSCLIHRRRQDHTQAVRETGAKFACSQDSESRPAPKTVDFNIHGRVGIRLLDPSPADTAAVAKQLGPMQLPLSQDPDIVVRFVKKLPTEGLRYVEFEGSGFTKDGFFLLKSGKRPAKVKIRFDQVGTQCEIVCESGLRSVPLLMAILNLTLLSKDCIPLHASAFTHQGKGILVTGWSKGGKTEALLAFAQHGARYVGDEWIILSGDGQKMYGIPENIRLWEWHLDNAPTVRSQVSRQDRILFRAIHGLEDLQILAAKNFGKTFPVRLLGRAMPMLKRQLNVCLKPETVFGSNLGPFEAKPEKLFLLLSDNDPTVRVERADPLTIARQMASSVRYEQVTLMEQYLASKFADPSMKSDFIEAAHKTQSLMLLRALEGKPAYTVRHPYPVSFDQLYEAMQPFVESSN